MDSTGEMMGRGPRSGSGSEYKRRYKEHDVRLARVAPCKPEASPVTVDARMETSTTNRRDFPEHPLQKQMPLKPSDNNLRTEGHVDFSSSYSLSFQGRTGERACPIRHEKEREELERFQGEPTYKAEFRQWDLQPRERRPAEQWAPSSTKMADTTTNRADFKEMRAPRRAIVKPEEELKRSDDPFVGETGYRESFKEHRIEPRMARHREEWNPPGVKFSHQTTQQNDFPGAYQPKRESFRPDRAAFASNEPFQATTTNQSDFQQNDFPGAYQPKRESFRPDRAAFVSNEPFQATTTNQSDFQQKPLGQRYVHSQPEYVRPEGQMDLTTTSKSQFPQYPVDQSRKAVEKPGSSHILRGTGPMAQTSGYNSDFTEYSSPRRDLIRPKASYEPSSERFEGESVAKTDYVAKELSPRLSYRPTWEPIHSEDPFQSSTENRASFVEQPLPPRRQRLQETYMAPSVPFKATTTNKESYLGEFAPKRGSFKPNQTATMSDAKFEGRTTFADAFRQHEVSPRQRHQYEAYVPPEGTMDMLTSNQETFQDFGQVSRHAIAKPGSSHVLRGQGKFADSSSYAGDFTAPPPQARHLILPKSDYKPNDVPFDHVPTYKASFTGAYAPKQGNFRPANRPLQNLNAFEDNVPPKPQPWRDVSPQIPPLYV